MIGLAKVLSITDSTPAFRQAAATARMSTQRSVGLIGDSNHTIFVCGPITAAGFASSSSDTNRRVMPNFEQQILDQVKRAAVDRRAAHDLVARLSSVNSAVDVAAMPELNSSAVSAPSTAASFCSTATTVGFS